ncbi:amino acid ABC transporter ATP-binding/permease protein [Pseudoclavibacter sp. 13-3]|uniref:amino acid ABC transporter ATP-binding/permease protein n=1 Tax=Pseudoclavibacter sp. 13-3 TaxID=2901228 RepID=UPI001E2A0F30|nr:ABC transporter ATP-binding protein [Pseudoclavibacter sp. 13-3]MCD7100632.1 ABC transporter ATP-binding protein/permease [Pseudoclavibacter sp. 13-3]
MTNATHPSTAATLRELLPMTKGFRGSLSGSLALRLISQATGIAAVVAGVLLVTASARDDVSAWTVALALIGLALVKGLARYGEQYLGHRVAFILLAHLRVRFFGSLLPQAPAVSARSASGELLSRASRDIDRLEVFFAHTIVPAVSAVVISVAVAVAQWLVAGWMPAVVLIVGLALAFGCAGLGLRGEAQMASDAARLDGESAQFAAETMHALLDLRGLDALARRGLGWRELNRAHTDTMCAEQRLGRLRRTLMTLAWLLTVAATLLVVVTAGPATGALIEDPLSAALAAAALAFTAFAAPESVVGFVNDWRAVQTATLRVQTTMTSPPEVEFPAESSAEQSPATGAAHGGAAVVIGPLEYQHDAARGGRGSRVRVPEPISVEAGAHVLVEGSSGSGKSTLVDLIARVHDPDSGSVQIAGQDLRSLSRADLVRTVAVVDQATFLFDASIAENLRIARPDAGDDDLRRVCATVGLGEFVEGLRQGIRTPLGRGHGRIALSGGQAQRLGLARALLAQTPVLLADEVTSQLDAGTADDIRRVVLDPTSGRTVIWVSHRDDAWNGPVITVGETGDVRLSAASRR